MFVVISIDNPLTRIETLTHVAELAMNLHDDGVEVSIDLDDSHHLVNRCAARGADFIYRVGWNQWLTRGMTAVNRAVWRLAASTMDDFPIPADEREAMARIIAPNWRSIRFPSARDPIAELSWSQGPICYDDYSDQTVPRFGLYRLRAGGGPLRAAIQTFTWDQPTGTVLSLQEFATE